MSITITETVANITKNIMIVVNVANGDVALRDGQPGG